MIAIIESENILSGLKTMHNAICKRTKLDRKQQLLSIGSNYMRVTNENVTNGKWIYSLFSDSK